MPDLSSAVGGLVILATALAGIIGVLVKKRNGNGYAKPWDGIERRNGVLEFREELRGELKELRAELREARHELREQLQPLVTKVAVLERDVEHLRARCPLLEGKR